MKNGKAYCDFLLFEDFDYDPRSNSFMKYNLRRSLLLYSICLKLYTGLVTPSLHLSIHCPVTCCLPLVEDTSWSCYFGRWYEQKCKSFHDSSQSFAFALCHKNISQMETEPSHWVQEEKTHNRPKQS